MKCFQCLSNEKSDLCRKSQRNSTPARLKYCKISSENYQCYTLLDTRTELIVRGCTSDKNEFTKQCRADPQHCHVCSSNECNGDPLNLAKRLICVQCLENDVKCAYDQRFVPRQVACRKNSSFVGPNRCYRYTFPEGGSRYGCLSDDPSFCKKKECFLCDETNCNKVVFMTQKCIQCISTDDDHCDRNTHLAKGRSCQEPNYLGLMGCFSVKQSEDRIINGISNDNYFNFAAHGVIQRGCSSSLDSRIKKDCTFKENANCVLCFGKNCNRHSMSGADDLGRWSVLAFVHCLLLIFLLR